LNYFKGTRERLLKNATQKYINNHQEHHGHEEKHPHTVDGPAEFKDNILELLSGFLNGHGYPLNRKNS